MKRFLESFQNIFIAYTQVLMQQNFQKLLYYHSLLFIFH